MPATGGGTQCVTRLIEVNGNRLELTRTSTTWTKLVETAGVEIVRKMSP